MVKDVVEATFAGNLSEIRMSDDVLEATLELRTFLFAAVYENEAATAEFKKATGILGGLWEKIRERPDGVPGRADDRRRGHRCGGAGLSRRHDRSLRRGASSKALFIPKPWVGPIWVDALTDRRDRP